MSIPFVSSKPLPENSRDPNFGDKNKSVLQSAPCQIANPLEATPKTQPLPIQPILKCSATWARNPPRLPYLINNGSNEALAEPGEEVHIRSSRSLTELPTFERCDSGDREVAADVKKSNSEVICQFKSKSIRSSTVERMSIVSENLDVISGNTAKQKSVIRHALFRGTRVIQTTVKKLLVAAGTGNYQISLIMEDQRKWLQEYGFNNYYAFLSDKDMEQRFLESYRRLTLIPHQASLVVACIGFSLMAALEAVAFGMAQEVYFQGGASISTFLFFSVLKFGPRPFCEHFNHKIMFFLILFTYSAFFVWLNHIYTLEKVEEMRELGKFNFFHSGGNMFILFATTAVTHLK
ncbi:hypothetical protein BC829DRAFT_249612 [Chytridium lagenaria]|nr:hypothetical protein BC829DRAFT_249612 [Chytridium lagenaria]